MVVCSEGYGGMYRFLSFFQYNIDQFFSKNDP